MKVADIETTDATGDGWRAWVSVHREPWGVSIHSDYQPPGRERDTWQDSGISFEYAHLDAMIDALQQIRRQLVDESDEPSPSRGTSAEVSSRQGGEEP